MGNEIMPICRQGNWGVQGEKIKWHLSILLKSLTRKSPAGLPGDLQHVLTKATDLQPAGVAHT